MKTKFNCLLAAASIAVTLFSCKKKTDDVKLPETETPLGASQEVIFRPKKIFVSNDSSIYRLVFENEYDELGRLKVEDYYYDTLSRDGFSLVLSRKVYSYSEKNISTKQFVKTTSEYANFYGQSGWDSLFLDNQNVKIRYKAFYTYLHALVNGNDTVGAKIFHDYTRDMKGDTTIINSKGKRYDQPYNHTKYIDKNNVVVKIIDSAGCTAIDNYKLERPGVFVSRYVLYNAFGENKNLFSFFERKLECHGEGQKYVSNFKWEFDTQERPTRLTLVDSANGAITKSYYRYEY